MHSCRHRTLNCNSIASSVKVTHCNNRSEAAMLLYNTVVPIRCSQRYFDTEEDPDTAVVNIQHEVRTVGVVLKRQCSVSSFCLCLCFDFLSLCLCDFLLFLCL